MAGLSPSGEERIRAILTEAVGNKKTSGLVFGATSAEKELCMIPAGARIFDDPSSGPVTADSVFWICSQSKMIASIATFQLIEAGKLALDTPAATILPQLANPVVLDPNPIPGQPNFRPAKERIRIRHLLNHSSGLFYTPEKDRVRQFDLPSGYSGSYGPGSPVEQFYDFLKADYPGVPLRYEPGTSFSYGFSSDTLGFIVEKVSGQTLEEYYKQHIFSPLGITASFYLTPELKDRLVWLSFRKPDGKIVPWSSNDQVPLIEQDPKKVNIHFAGAGIYCSMRGYLALLRHFLQILSGTADTPILSAASLQTFFEPTLTSSGEEALSQMGHMLRGIGDQWGNGLCVNTADIPGKRRKGSGWWYGWAGSYHFVDPETGVAAVFGSQMVPTRDPEVVKLWEQLEGALYACMLG